jgi:hypothetical protein
MLGDKRLEPKHRVKVRFGHFGRIFWAILKKSHAIVWPSHGNDQISMEDTDIYRSLDNGNGSIGGNGH